MSLPFLVAGYQDGPVLLQLDPTAGFPVHTCGAFAAIGASEWALHILPNVYPESEWKEQSLDRAVLVAVFCAHVAHRFAQLVGPDFDVLTVTKEGVRNMDQERVRLLTKKAAGLLGEWFDLVVQASISTGGD